MKLSLKDAAKKNQIDVCKILAKEVAQSRKAVNKLYASKAQINSVMMSMDQQLCEYCHYSNSSPLYTRGGTVID